MGNRIIKVEKPGEKSHENPVQQMVVRQRAGNPNQNEGQNEESEEQRLRRNRWRVIENFIQSSDANIRGSVRANLEIMEYEFWFKFERRYTKEYVDRNVLGHTMRGYKLARVMHHGQLLTDCIAMVTLHVPMDAGNIRLSNGNVINLPLINDAAGLDQHFTDPEGRKFCAGKVYVYAIQYIGDAAAIQRARENVTDVVSNVDRSFQYELAHVITEPNFGKQGRGCIQGIHFFCKVKDMLKYAGAKGFLADEVKVPCISSPIFEERKDNTAYQPALQDIIRPPRENREEVNYNSYFTNSFYARNPGAREFIRGLI